MTTLETDFTTQFVEGWAEYLAAAGIGLTWKTADAYTTSETGIYLASFPTDPAFDGSPAVVLTPYTLSNNATYAQSTLGLQVKIRTPGQDPRGAWSLDSQIQNVILGNWPLNLPNGVHIETALDAVTSTPLGRDEKQRLIVAASYPFRVYRPGAHRS